MVNKRNSWDGCLVASFAFLVLCLLALWKMGQTEETHFGMEFIFLLLLTGTLNLVLMVCTIVSPMKGVPSILLKAKAISAVAALLLSSLLSACLLGKGFGLLCLLIGAGLIFKDVFLKR